MNLSRTKTLNPTPPEKGSFPLDHFGECDAEMHTYKQCLQTYESVSRYCEDAAKGYLDCRMRTCAFLSLTSSELSYSHSFFTCPSLFFTHSSLVHYRNQVLTDVLNARLLTATTLDN
eukprot:TRINITY_DN586_c0_g1_i3.p1 TRINITY_DN586_c0_g1~~TRINITY_DN586_c0_g1_i3.p1  ORF type:complete len:117 (-),score=24.08 TRINITY_DN586_c0_g1_i3:49-399(-)